VSIHACGHLSVYMYLYMHVYMHTQGREEIVRSDSLENLWASTAGSALLVFKEKLRKKLMCSQKLPGSN